MRQELQKIDELCRSIEEDYYSLPYRLAEESNPTVAKKLYHRWEHVQKIWAIVYQEWRQIEDTLSNDEIIEAYRGGGGLFRSSMVGLIQARFCDKFIPLMIEAIERGDEGTYHFLGKLDRENIDGIENLIIKMLDSRFPINIDTAILFARNYHLTEAIPKLRQLTKSNIAYIAKLAQEVINELDS